MNRHVSLALFLALVLGGRLVLGFLTAPGAWYAGLAKPAFNPPAWLFGPVWTVLYILIAVSGWRVWQCDPHGWPMNLWWAQLARVDTRLHRHGVAAGPRCGVAFRALCCLGGVRFGAERFDLGIELKRRNMSGATRHRLPPSRSPTRCRQTTIGRDANNEVSDLLAFARRRGRTPCSNIFS